MVPPYARVPQITLNMNRQTDVHLDFGLQGEYVEFDHPTLLNGTREILYPSISNSGSVFIAQAPQDFGTEDVEQPVDVWFGQHDGLRVAGIGRHDRVEPPAQFEQSF